MELAGKRWILECSSRYVTARDPKNEIRRFERLEPVATANEKASEVLVVAASQSRWYIYI